MISDRSTDVVSAHFSFETSAFDDSAEVRSETVNGIVGHSLATWLANELKAAGFAASDIWAEDHGWDFAITHAGVKYHCACSLATEDGAPFEGHVAVAKRRSLWDRLTGRNAYTKDDPVAAEILAVLQRSADVAKLAAEQ